jgi:hypothetical protein
VLSLTRDQRFISDDTESGLLERRYRGSEGLLRVARWAGRDGMLITSFVYLDRATHLNPNVESVGL